MSAVSNSCCPTTDNIWAMRAQGATDDASSFSNMARDFMEMMANMIQQLLPMLMQIFGIAGAISG